MGGYHMFFAENIHGERIGIEEADIKQKYFCPACKEPMYQKHGSIVAHHFAHKRKESCDPWYTGKMSEWHKRMQELFPKHCREIVVRDRENQDEYHIADVIVKNTVFEFQHSAISQNEFLARTEFYLRQGYGLNWFFDFCNLPQKQKKLLYYTREYDSDWIRVIWPGKDRVRFLDYIDYDLFGDALRIYFHVYIGKGHKIECANEYREWEKWEYLSLEREDLFIRLDLRDFDSVREFYALPCQAREFYEKLKKIGRNQ